MPLLYLLNSLTQFFGFAFVALHNLELKDPMSIACIHLQIAPAMCIVMFNFYIQAGARKIDLKKLRPSPDTFDNQSPEKVD